MRTHLALLRAYYAARQRRLRAAMKAKPPWPWDEQIVLEWAALWRIEPFQHVSSAAVRGALPMRQELARQQKFGGATFPEGPTWMCDACGATWLVLK